jgi:hypothetical protein
MQCDVIQVTFVYQTKSKILTYRKVYKVLENKLNIKMTKEFTLSFLKTKPSLEPLTINNRPIEGRIPQSYWVFNYLQISNGIHISITCVPRQVSVCSPWECWNVMVSIHEISVQCIVTSSDLFWSTLVRYGTLPYRHS